MLHQAQSIPRERRGRVATPLHRPYRHPRSGSHEEYKYLPRTGAQYKFNIGSVDTFRASIAEHCVKEYGVQIINDVSGGQADEHMYSIAALLGVPYILTHTGGSQWNTSVFNLASRINELHLMGMNDIIIDPGFGFGKTLDENYHLMAHLEELHMLRCPLLVGVSRKSMIYNLLQNIPEEALNGTTALHTIALMKGAHILRVHDVKAAVEAIKIVDKIHNS